MEKECAKCGAINNDGMPNFAFGICENCGGYIDKNIPNEE